MVLLFHCVFPPTHLLFDCPVVKHACCDTMWCNFKIELMHRGPRTKPKKLNLHMTPAAQAPVCNLYVGSSFLSQQIWRAFVLSGWCYCTEAKETLTERWRQQTRSPPSLQGVATGMQDSTSDSRMAKQVRRAVFHWHITKDTEVTVSRAQGKLSAAYEDRKSVKCPFATLLLLRILTNLYRKLEFPVTLIPLS